MFQPTQAAVDLILVGDGQPNAPSLSIRLPHRRNSGEDHV
jgi:hypothetical protein